MEVCSAALMGISGSGRKWRSTLVTLLAGSQVSLCESEFWLGGKET